jgi:hypothetical protein
VPEERQQKVARQLHDATHTRRLGRTTYTVQKNKKKKEN